MNQKKTKIIQKNTKQLEKQIYILANKTINSLIKSLIEVILQFKNLNYSYSSKWINI
jgi:hypothetical protein